MKNLFKDIRKSQKIMINPAYRLLFMCIFMAAKFERISDIKI